MTNLALDGIMHDANSHTSDARGSQATKNSVRNILTYVQLQQKSRHWATHRKLSIELSQITGTHPQDAIENAIFELYSFAADDCIRVYESGGGLVDLASTTRDAVEAMMFLQART